MDSLRFDTLVNVLATRRPRRAIIPILATLGLGRPAQDAAGAKKNTTNDNAVRVCTCATGDASSCKTQKKEQKKAKRLLRRNPCAYRGRCTGVSGCALPVSPAPPPSPPLSPPPAPTCIPNCVDKICGDNGCGGSCGSCGSTANCYDGACTTCDVCLDATACAFTSVAAAVRAATEGEVLHICPGRYPTRDVRIDKRLTLTGAGTGEHGTVLDAGDQGRVFVVELPQDDPDGPVQLARLTVTGGFLENEQDQGGGVFNRNGHLILDGAIVTRNVAPDGGGISSFRAVTLVGGSRVEDNIALDVGGGILGLTVTLNGGSQVTGNRAAEGGGGISAYGALTVHADCAVTNNRAGGNGGGIDMGGTLRLEAGSRVTGNRAGGEGGGVYMNFGETPVNNGTIASNHPTNCAGNPTVPRCPAE